MATYTDDIELYEHPEKLLASGAAQGREHQAVRLGEPNLHAKLIQRMVMGNMVVDQEVVTRTFPEGTGRIELIATYWCRKIGCQSVDQLRRENNGCEVIEPSTCTIPAFGALR